MGRRRSPIPSLKSVIQPPYTGQLKMTHRASLLGVALFVLMPGIARADITATYKRPGTVGTLTVEVSMNGDVRAGDDKSGYYLWTNGQGYEVRPGPGGPSVTRTADTAAARAGSCPASEIMKLWLPVDTVSINGWTGTRFFIDGAHHNPGAMPFVISRDPALATLASGYRQYDAMRQTSFPGDNSPERVSFRDVIFQGAPIEIYGMQLVAVSTAAIPSTRFRVPAEPVSAALVRQHAEAVRAATVTASPPSAEERRREQDRFIKRAVWAYNRRWLLTDHGTLSSVASGERIRRAEPVPEPAADICLLGGEPVILGVDGQLSRLERGAWKADQRLELGGEPVRALSCTKGRLLVVMQRRLAIVQDGRQRYATLSKALTGPIVRTAPFDDGTTLLLGLDEGEWGGGLERIDTVTGEVREVPGLGGPINGVGPAPGRADCLVATVGLVHFFSSGQISEVCGDKVRRLYYKPYTMETSWPADPPKLPFQTLPFYTLIQSGGDLWVAGGDGLYTIAANRPITFRKMPALEQIDGVAISFAVPGLALVRTDVDAHVSLGGGAPLLVAR